MYIILLKYHTILYTILIVAILTVLSKTHVLCNNKLYVNILSVLYIYLYWNFIYNNINLDDYFLYKKINKLLCIINIGDLCYL